jgi:cyclase
MTMNRRDFLIKSGMVVSLGVLTKRTLWGQAAPTPTPGVQMPAPVTQFTLLRRNVGTFTARGGTIGWLVNREAVVGVDTQFADTAALFLDGLPGRDGRSFDAIINTHHHGDHTGGNATLRPSTKTLVAHANVPTLMQARAQPDGNAVDRAMIPDTTFTQEWRQDFGDETIRANYFGPAHTKGDIVTHFEKANIVHLGDLMFNRMYPVIDRPGGANIRSWVTLLEKVAADYPADAIYIFGHSNAKFPVTGTKADLLAFRDYLSALLAHVEQAVRAGQSKEEVMKLENLPGFPDYHLPAGRTNRLPMNLSVAYDELASP